MKPYLLLRYCLLVSCLLLTSNSYSINFKDFIQLLAKEDLNSNLPNSGITTHNHIVYRETDRGHNVFTANQYTVLEQMLTKKMQFTHTQVIECVDCKINTIIKHPDKLERKIRLSSTQELKDIATQLGADSILIWGLVTTDMPVIYCRIISASSGIVIWNKLIYE
jgi:hypothetical protein